MKLAITGGTGFVGSHLIEAALGAGHAIRALTRRDQPPRDALEWVPGSLEDRDALRKLVTDADAVIHVAGAISASDAAGFEKGNVDGTLAMLAAATAGGVHRFVHVSSLAAREPKLSLYGASKARAEEPGRTLRPRLGDGPPAGGLWPRRQGNSRAVPDGQARADGGAAARPAVADPRRRSRAALARARRSGRAFRHRHRSRRRHYPAGWTHRQFARAIGTAIGGKKPAIVPAPGPLLRIAAHADQLVRGPEAKHASTGRPISRIMTR